MAGTKAGADSGQVLDSRACPGGKWEPPDKKEVQSRSKEQGKEQVFVNRLGQHHFARKCTSERSDLDYYVVAGRDELGFAVSVRRKNR